MNEAGEELRRAIETLKLLRPAPTFLEILVKQVVACNLSA